MRNTRIFTPQELRGDADFELEPAPSRHLARALRMGVGDTLTLFDGRGGEYPATITAVARNRVAVHTGGCAEGLPESPLRVHLGIAISRGERMDWVVQKSTELGVGAITPLYTARTEVRLDAAREEKKLSHWRQVIASACEQCGRCALPGLHPPTALADWLHAVEADAKLVLHPRGEEGSGAGPPGSVALLAGPEGGFADEEVDAAVSAGFSSLRLGPRVLRTETAPLAALAVLQARWGDLRG